ncbi:cation:proton antiporter [Algoriphagus aestuariicola]|jgi:NhaP-type Na+/H+ or K+/H+ antiporter|uniref:Cation:proton antiporter n=1 Tax=Algoriphagus aestuariicola TaxID=1852016 RepID=A0ABS3BVT4_9BACT|nr:cation:proton antiporter [Algoriphagus aestuariicola]MBN7803180.1 cation:proton antiporter [Algoriphagus aestuariicola]
MHDHPIVVFMALLILGYGLFSRKAENSVVTAPMVFVVIGLLVSFFDLELLQEGPKANFVKPLMEFTLLLVLFIDGSTIDLKSLKQDRALPFRLLTFGLPLTMILGAYLAIVMFPEIRPLTLILMAFILSPTDAALGQAVVTGEQVPRRIRQTINVESGLNDGIGLPPILVCIALLSGSAGEGFDSQYWLAFVAKQFVFGPLIGGLIGWLGGKLVEIAFRKGMITPIYQMLASVSIAVLAFSGAEHLGGNGFIAAYVAGMLLGTQNEHVRERMKEFGEAGSQIMILFIFLLFGMLLIPISYPLWNWKMLAYALLSLTVIRMVPAAISLYKSGLNQKTIWFIGWFGPRGIASVLYMLMVIIELGTVGYEDMVSIITLTVLLSIFLHGITAVPLSGIFKRKY